MSTGPELRICPISGRWVAVSGARHERPGGELRIDGGPPARVSDHAADPFAGGNEQMTPPELAAEGRPGNGAADGPGWQRRAIPNRYPALDAPDGVAAGAHEVLIADPGPVCSLGDLSDQQLGATIAFWQTRMRARRAEGWGFLHLWVNEGRGGGASLAHSHAQLVAAAETPPDVAAELARRHDDPERDPLAAYVRDELAHPGERVIARCDGLALISPFAARVPYELLLVPSEPASSPSFEDDERAAAGGARLLSDAFARLREVLGGRPPLNLWVRSAPQVPGWWLSVVPRLTGIAGFELGTGMYLNTVAPERATASLRAAGPEGEKCC